MGNKQVILALVIGFVMFMWVEHKLIPWTVETMCANVLICEDDDQE